MNKSKSEVDLLEINEINTVLEKQYLLWNNKAKVRNFEDTDILIY